MKKAEVRGYFQKACKNRKKKRPRRLDQALQNRLQDIRDDSLVVDQKKRRSVSTLQNQLPLTS